MVLAGMEVNAANVRIWIHEKDLGCLERALWEGHGHLLLGQTANNNKVRKFLEAVPRIMVSDLNLIHLNSDFKTLFVQIYL
jgi:hypothetical protein